MSSRPPTRLRVIAFKTSKYTVEGPLQLGAAAADAPITSEFGAPLSTTRWKSPIGPAQLAPVLKTYAMRRSKNGLDEAPNSSGFDMARWAAARNSSSAQ